MRVLPDGTALEFIREQPTAGVRIACFTQCERAEWQRTPSSQSRIMLAIICCRVVAGVEGPVRQALDEDATSH